MYIYIVIQLLKVPMVIWLKRKVIIIGEISCHGRFYVILHAIALKGYLGILQKQIFTWPPFFFFFFDSITWPFWRLVFIDGVWSFCICKGIRCGRPIYGSVSFALTSSTCNF
jgi:hypothetical protein